MEGRTYVVVCFSTIFFLMFTLFGAIFPQTYEILLDRRSLLERGHRVLEEWRHQPLVQRRKFYFFNASGDAGNGSASDLKVQEIGPFTYDVNHKDPNSTSKNLGDDDLTFVPEESVGLESALVHLPIRRTGLRESGKVTSKPRLGQQGVLVRRSVRKLVRDLLSNGGSWASSAPLRDAYSSDISSSEACPKKSVLLQLLDETFHDDPSTMNVYRALPCLEVVFRNRSDIETRTSPQPFNMLVDRMILSFHAPVDASEAEPRQSAQSSPSPAEVRFVISSFAAQLSIEPSSLVVTSIALDYRMSFSFLRYRNGSLSSVTLPFLRTEIDCQSSVLTDGFLYRYIVFPRLFKEQILPRIVFFAVCFLISSSTIIYFLVYHNRLQKKDEEKSPLLKPRRKIVLESFMT